MHVLLALIFLMTSTPAGASKKAVPAPTPTPSSRYTLSDVKTPYDPFQTSIEATSPSLVSVLLTLGLIYFYRKGSIQYEANNARIQIER